MHCRCPWAGGTADCVPCPDGAAGVPAVERLLGHFSAYHALSLRVRACHSCAALARSTAAASLAAPFRRNRFLLPGRGSSRTSWREILRRIQGKSGRRRLLGRSACGPQSRQLDPTLGRGRWQWPEELLGRRPVPRGVLRLTLDGPPASLQRASPEELPGSPPG